MMGWNQGNKNVLKYCSVHLTVRSIRLWKYLLLEWVNLWVYQAMNNEPEHWAWAPGHTRSFLILHPCTPSGKLWGPARARYVQQKLKSQLNCWFFFPLNGMQRHSQWTRKAKCATETSHGIETHLSRHLVSIQKLAD